MKQLTFKLILPLTVISFATITKWWYALLVDAPDTLFAGFPFPFVCDGWHTSMSLQFFVTEFFADFLTYFLFWFIVIFCINCFWTKINSSKTVTIVLWVLTGLVVSGATLIASNSDNLFYVKRPFDIDIMETGYKFVWQQTERPDYHKYHPEEKKELNVDHIKNIQSVFEDYTQHQESTDSQDDKDLMTKSLKSLTTVTDKDDLDLLINVWMYYDPTDFPTRDLVFELFKTRKNESIKAINKRIDEKESWEDEDNAPFSELKYLIERLENE